MNKLTKTIILVIEGISSEEYILSESMFPILKNNFPIKVEVLMPNAYDGNLLEELSNVPLCPSKQKELLVQCKSVGSALRKNSRTLYKVLRPLFPIEWQNEKDLNIKLPDNDRFSRTELLLSAWQLLEEGYPLPMKGPLKKKYQDYIHTKDEYAEVHPFSPIFAIDCEMCETTIGEKELTRISIVNEDLEVVYDTLVKPRNKITNYLTRFSGITKKLLDPVTTRLEEVQLKVREILPADAILLGQSFFNDLHAMKMMHPYVIDTSVIFNITGIRTKKTKLSTLSREFLNENIQDSRQGHCSIEDSSACMKLVKLKLANSVEFGDAVLVGTLAAELHVKEIQTQNRKEKNLVENLNQVVGGEELTTTLFDEIANGNKKVGAIGTEEVVHGYSEVKAKKSNKKNISYIRGYVANTNESIINRTCEVAEENDCLLTHVYLEKEKLDKKIKKVNEWTEKILKIMPLNGMCLVLLGNGASSSCGVCFINIRKPIAPRLLS